MWGILAFACDDCPLIVNSNDVGLIALEFLFVKGPLSNSNSDFGCLFLMSHLNLKEFNNGDFYYKNFTFF